MEPKLSIERVRWGDEKFALAKREEFRIFGIVNGFVEEKDLAAGEVLIYRPYERWSEFHLAWVDSDSKREIVGIIRLVRYDPSKDLNSFSTLKDGRSYAWRDDLPPEQYLHRKWIDFFEALNPTTIAELATQAILPPFRRRLVVDHLWYSILKVSEREGVSIWTMALVLPLFRYYKWVFPRAINAIGRVMPNYVGADSIPAMVHIDHPEILAYEQRFLNRSRSLDTATLEVLAAKTVSGSAVSI
jgi:hypothetical protein